LSFSNSHDSAFSDGYGAVTHNSQFMHLLACSRFLTAFGKGQHFLSVYNENIGAFFGSTSRSFIQSNTELNLDTTK
jgi:hypothetical protein